MIKHYFKIIWNRKKQNFLLFLELFIAFLVVCMVFVQGADLWINYNKPLGFQYENHWVINIIPKRGIAYQWNDEVTAKLEQIFMAVRQMDGVEGAAGADMAPFDYNMWTWGDSLPSTGEFESVEISIVSDEFPEVMGLELLQGRWFSEEDNANHFAPVVVNQYFAAKAYPGEDPIGKPILPTVKETLSPEEQSQLRESRIIGVMRDYKKQGVFAKAGSFALMRSSPKIATLDTAKVFFNADNPPPNHILIKVAPQYMNASFEEALLNNLEKAAPDWVFLSRPLAEVRAGRMKDTLTPLLSFGLVAGFLVIMVGLGLVGVIWQNVTSRIGELGLRRAIGANARHIFGQIIGELFILVILTLVAGSLVFIQFPLLNLVEDLKPDAYLLGWVLAVLFLLMVTFVCGFYPSKIATHVHPTQALQEE